MSNGRRERTCGDARGAVVSACMQRAHEQRSRRAPVAAAAGGALMREAISMMREANRAHPLPPRPVAR